MRRRAQHCFELAGNAGQFLHQLARLLVVERAAHLAQIHGEKEQRGQLAVNALVEATPISGPACV